MARGIDIEKTFTIPNRLGMHARAATRLARLSADFQSTIHIVNDDGEFDAKSTLDLLALGAAQGTEVTIRIHGDDAGDAMTAIDELFQQNLGDDDSEFEN